MFGKIKDEKMILNDAGRMVESQWLALKDRFSNIELHEFQVMPDHFHSILEITVTATVATTAAASPRKITVGDIIGAFKSIVTVEYIHGVKLSGWPRFKRKVLQRNYHDRILRGEKSRQRVAKYIIDNPKNWRDT